MATTTVPSVDDVTRIAAIESPVLRNLAITDCYSRLAAAFAERVGEGANWCAYATWASKQAGRSIRGEDMQASSVACSARAAGCCIRSRRSGAGC